MAQTHEWMFYEYMWRLQTQGIPFPQPWWVQQYFKYWIEPYDMGLFETKEAAFSSNANYRYWNMVGVKDAHQESLVGQGGEIEPVYDKYALNFFLFDPGTRSFSFPQKPKNGEYLFNEYDSGYIPVIITDFKSLFNVSVRQKVIATTIDPDQKIIVLSRYSVSKTASSVPPANLLLCLAVMPAGPTGFQRHDKAGRYSADRRITYMEYHAADRCVSINSKWGPLFDTAPDIFGLYGNEGSSYDPGSYVNNNPFSDLSRNGALNNRTTASDNIAGLCCGVFAWRLDSLLASNAFTLDIRLPVDDYRGGSDLVNIRVPTPDELESTNRSFWVDKLDSTGFQASLPSTVSHLVNLYKISRANILILADNGEIHPGPTIYDSFWVRDSSVEGISAALAGDMNLAQAQFGTHYPTIFSIGYGRIGPVSEHGIFAGEHEREAMEWDCNGQALWALCTFDRIKGASASFGRGLFSPYIIDGSRWIRDNRSAYGLLHSGWSAEHIGDRDKPHFWDDFWSLAGLWEAAQLARRINASEEGELWYTYNDLKNATANSIRWVLSEQRRYGFWETFIPTGPGDVGRLDSTMIGTVAYFHPCHLYMGAKLGPDIDWAARMSLETIYAHFMDGGYRHDTSWYCYGPYLTLQLAHAFLLIGDIKRMDQCLAWSVYHGMFNTVDRSNLPGVKDVKVVLGAWNEQHCYPIAKNFAEIPNRWWYMGDIPHGWACAEFMLLLRNILFFEADIDNDPHIYIAPGIMSHWVNDDETVSVSDAPTLFGQPFGYTLVHHKASRTVDINITQSPVNIRFIYPCRFGSAVQSAVADGQPVLTNNTDIFLPKGTVHAVIKYA